MTSPSIQSHIDEALRLDKEATPGEWMRRDDKRETQNGSVIFVPAVYAVDAMSSTVTGDRLPFRVFGAGQACDMDFAAGAKSLLPLLASDCASEGRRADEAEAEAARWKLQSDDWQKRGWELGKQADDLARQLVEVTKQRDEAAELVGASRAALLARIQAANCCPDSKCPHCLAEQQAYLIRHRAKQQPGETR